MTTLILTIVGPDQPGLVSRLAAVIDEHEASWLTSRMAQLASKFAGIVEVSVPKERASGLEAALAGLAGDGLELVVTRGEGETPPVETWRLHLVGHDQPGIVYQVSEALSAVQVSIEELSTETSEAPMAGGLLFSATALLRAPSGLSPDELGDRLEAIARELMVDLELSAD